MFLTTFVHDLPPSRVTCTLPSSVPTQMIGPPDDFCLLLSFVVRSGLITSHDCPWVVDLKSTLPPKYTVCPSGPSTIGEFQL